MATYLQGVTDYIPQLQPFQPDLNLYANVLQTKQTQYDTAWKSLNSVYGQYYYADLSRENNIERKEEILKNIDFNLKRVAGLDLSLTQNVQQATQVFKPFYEDQYLMKDMAWTKNYSNQRNRAQGYKNSLKEDQRGMYWDGGVRALDYMREEFQEASDADSLNFGNAEYTPYVNAIKEAQKVAKEAGLSIESTNFSDDGKWIVTTKNGEQLMTPLSRLFEAQLGNDPAIQAVYKTQAYLDRKDYAASNAAQFNGDKNAAEMQYLQTNYNMLKEQRRKEYKRLEEENSVYDAKIKDIEKRMQTSKSTKLSQYLDQLKNAKATNQSVLDRVQADNEALAEQDGTATTSTGEQNPYGDLKALRWKVDNAMAYTLMSKDFNEAAQIFAMKDAKQSIEANPYAVNEQKHQFAMQEVALRNQGLENAAKIRNAGEIEKLKMQAALDAGVAAINPLTGDLEYIKSYDGIFTTSEVQGATTGEGESYATVNRMLEDQTTNQYGVPYMQETLRLLEKAKGQGVMTDAEIKNILGMDLNTAMNKFNGNSTAFVSRTMGAAGMSKLQSSMDSYLKQNNQLSLIADGIPEFAQAKSKFTGFTTYQSAVEDWRLKSSNEVRQKLEAQGFKDADLLFDKNGHMRGYKEYKANMEARYGKGSMGSEKSGTGRGFFSDTFNYGVSTAASLWWAGAYGDKESESYENYAKLWRAANDVYKGQMNTKAPPGITSYSGGGGGIAATGIQNVSVSNKAPGMLGTEYYRQFEREVRNTTFSPLVGEGGSRFSFNGKDEYGYKNYDNVKGQFLMNHIANQMANAKEKFNFDLASSTIAGNKAGLGAMIIKVTPEMLKGLVSTNEDDDNNMFSRAEAQTIYTNGLTVFKEGGWNNGLYTSSYMDPVSASVEYFGKYEESDVYGNSSYLVEKDKLNLADYAVTTRFKTLDNNTGEMINTENVSRGYTIGKNFSVSREDWLQSAELNNQYNTGKFLY